MEQTIQAPPKRKPGEVKTRMGLSLDAETRLIADELARRYHGENISYLIRKLLREAWVKEQDREAVPA